MTRLSLPAPLLPLALAGALLATACGGSAASAPTVLLVSLDTTRADRIGCYGKPDAGTPVIDGLAADGVRFDAAYTVAPITCPSHSSLLTGHVPPVHGVRDNGAYSLPEEAVTLAELCAEAGWRTGAFVGAFPVSRSFGLDQGFDVFDDSFDARRADTMYDERTAQGVVDAALAFVDELAGDEPALLWVHLFDPHRPWRAPGRGVDPYQDEIRVCDEQLGRLLEGLADAGRDAQLHVALVADHGEGLGEHEEQTHTQLLYDSTLRVPMILTGPELPAGAVVRDTVSIVDVLPTLTARLGLPTPPELAGRDLAPSWDGRVLTPRGVYAETLFPELHNGWSRLYAWVGDGEKLIHAPDAASRRYELFDLRADPGELSDLASADDRRTARLAGELQRFLDALPAPLGDAAAPADDETLARLEALGYVAPAPRDDERGAHPADMVFVSEQYYKVRGLARSGRTDDAREALVAISERDPGGLTELELRAEIALAEGGRDPAQLELAEQLFGQAVQRAPQRRGLWRALVGVQRLRGRLQQALVSLAAAAEMGKATKALTEEQQRVLDAARKQAFAHENDGRAADALALWEGVLALTPDDRTASSAAERLRARVGG